MDKHGLMEGLNRKADFLKKHGKGSCMLFMTEALSASEKHGWGKGLDKRTLPGPYGRPRDHVWVGREAAQTKSKNTDLVSNPSR